MLVLRRKVKEAIVLDETITVYVLGIEGNQIKMGITAPPATPIVRGELLATPPVLAPEPDEKVQRRAFRSRSRRRRGGR